MEYNGKHVYSREDFTFENAQIGDYVDGCIVMDYMDMLPPVNFSTTCAQIGEPRTMRFDQKKSTYRPTYSTFRLNKTGMKGPFHEDAFWIYCGDCFRGETARRGDEPRVWNDEKGEWEPEDVPIGGRSRHEINC